MQPAFVVSSGPRSGLKSQSWNLDAVWCDALLRNLYVRCFANNRRSPCGFAQRELDLRGKSAIGRAQVKIRPPARQSTSCTGVLLFSRFWERGVKKMREYTGF